MRAIKVYQPPGRKAPVNEFLAQMDERLRRKLCWQIFRLAGLQRSEMKEPHYKHFSLERYNSLFELREKGQILVRIVYTISGGDIILLVPFAKRKARDTERALEQSLKILAEIRDHPETVVNFNFTEEKSL